MTALDEDVIFLAADRDRQLRPLTDQIIAREFLRRSEIPSAGGGTMSPFYNEGSLTMSTIRGLLLRAVLLGEDQHYVCAGDSKVEGTGAGDSQAYNYAWAGILRRMLGAVEGFIPANESGNAWDDRWTTVGMVRTTNTQMGIVPAAGAIDMSVEFTSTDEHVGTTWHVHIPDGGTVDITVDGGTAETFTIPAGDGYTPITPTVTGDANHTYLLESTAAGFHPVGVTMTYSGPRLKVSRVARGGSYASQWLPGYSSTGTGLWDALQVAAPDVLLMQIGTNQPANDGPLNASNIGLMWDEIAALDIPAMVIAPGGLGGVGGRFPTEDYEDMWAAHYTAALKHGFPLVDFQKVIGDYEHASALGLMYDDLHESRAGYAHNASAVLHLISVTASAPAA